MKSPFTFETEPLPTAPLGKIGELEGEFESDRFLGWLGNLFGQRQIVDRTAFTPKENRKGNRDIKKVYALVLHQMAFSRGNDQTRYDTVNAHFAILPDGTILQLHPLTAYLWASDGLNPGSVAVEFAGNFPNTKGKCWEAKTYGCHKVTPEQIEAGRYLVKYLIDTIGLTHILAHRQSRDTRENDPGPDIWYHVGQWAIEQYGLKDGGPTFKVGSGKPIPDEWRNWGRVSREAGFSLESLDELEGEDWFGEVDPEFSSGSRTSYFSSGIERALVRSAIRGGTTDENQLTDLIFFRRHPERNGCPISRSEPNAQQLGREWLDIRDRLVRPGLAGTAPAPTPAPGPAPSPTDLLPVAGMEKTTTAFQKKVIRIAQGLGTDPNYLMAIMSFESGFDPAARNPYSGATGLIQFMPKTAKVLGTTTDALAGMSAEQQLDYVAAYFAPYTGRLKTLEDAYMAVLWPDAIGKGPDFVLFASPTTAYTQNKALDINKDGRVTVAEAASFVRKRFRSTGSDLEATFKRYREFDEELSGSEPGNLESELLDEEARRIGRPVIRRAGSSGRPCPPPRAPVRGPRTPRPPRRPPRVIHPPWPVPVATFGEPPEPGTEYVRWVQHSLSLILGLPLPLNGVMNPETREAIRDFQTRMGLLADGIVGPETQQALVDERHRLAAGGALSEPEALFPQAEEFASDEQPDPEFGDQELEFSLSSFPSAVQEALRNGREVVASKLAIAYGHRDENQLTDLVFFARHPERSGRLIVKDEPDFKSLSREWQDIRDQLIRPMLSSPTLTTPLAALSASEETEYASLPLAARAQFDQLRVTIQTYRGVARAEGDRGSRVLLERGIFRTITNLLPDLIRLTQINRLPSGWDLNAAQPLLVGNVLYNMAFPETINQGGTDRLGGTPDPTCFSASTQILLARRFPATYVRYVKELATTDRCTFAAGDSIGPLTFVSTSLYKSLDSVLLQTAFDRYFKTKARSGSYQPGDELKVHRQVFGPSRPPRQPTSDTMLARMAAFFKAFVVKGGNTPPFEIVNLCTGDPDVQCGNHTVVLTRVTTGRVFFYNPWANEEERNTMFGKAQVSVSGNGERPAESSMSLTDFVSQITTVFHN